MMGQNSIGRASLLATFALGAIAQGNETEEYWEATGPVLVSNPREPGTESYELFEKANANPNDTRSVTFKLFDWHTEDLEVADREWTWRINISDFSVPNARLSDGSEMQDPHIINTVYDLSWGGGGSFSEALAGSENPLCMAYMDIDFARNVTNKFTEENADSPDCTPVLGADCVRAIRNNGGIRGVSQGRCAGVDQSWYAIPECADTLSTGNMEDDMSSIWTATINGARSIDEGSEERKSGDGFFSKTSALFDNSNPGSSFATPYLNASTRLHIMMLQAALPLSAGNETISKPSLLCTRVVANRLPNEDSEDTAGDGESEDGESVGFRVRASLAATFTAVFAAALASGWL